MADPLLLALDQGTSSSRAVIFDGSGQALASAQVPLPIQYPADGWVEQDPLAIWNSQLQAMQQLEAQLSPEQRAAVAACGITNQRETTVLWRSADGQPCGPALVWQDRRTASICRQWSEQPGAESWQHRTGLVLDPYFSASKVLWLLENNAEAAAAKAAGTLRFGTVDRSPIAWDGNPRSNGVSPALLLQSGLTIHFLSANRSNHPPG